MTRSPSYQAPETCDALREASRWRLLSLLFECPGGEWKQHLASLAGSTPDPELRRAAEAALEEAAPGPYHSIFGPGGPAPPREASYHDSLQLGYLLSELRGYYGAFHYRPSLGEPPDHVAVQLGFVAYLHLKLAYAVEHGDSEAAGVTRRAIREFTAGHLSRFAEPLSASLASCGVCYLEAAGKALLRFAGPAPARHPSQLPILDPAGESGEFECEQ